MELVIKDTRSPTIFVRNVRVTVLIVKEVGVLNALKVSSSTKTESASKAAREEDTETSPVTPSPVRIV